MSSFTTKIMDERVPVYAAPNVDAAHLFVLTDFPQARLGAPINGFIEIALPDGRAGFVLVTTKVLRLKEYALKQDNVALHANPDAASPIVATLAVGALITVRQPSVQSNNGTWMEVSTEQGTIGFVQEGVKATPLASGGSEMARHQRRARAEKTASAQMAIGIFVFVVGALVLTLSYFLEASPGGVTYILAGAAILSGVFWFFVGLSSYRKQLRKARRP